MPWTSAARPAHRDDAHSLPTSSISIPFPTINPTLNSHRPTPYTPYHLSLPSWSSPDQHTPNHQNGNPQDRRSQPHATSPRPSLPKTHPLPLQHIHNQKPILRHTNRIRAPLPNLHHPGPFPRRRTRIRVPPLLDPTPLLIPRCFTRASCWREVSRLRIAAATAAERA